MSSKAAGGCLLVALGAGATGVLLAVAPDAGRLIFWGVGVVVLVWTIGRPHKIDNPSPPPPELLSENENPQFSIVPDPDNPARHIVRRNPQKETPS